MTEPTTIAVTVRRGRFNLLDPREESLNLYVRIPAFSAKPLNIGVKDRNNLVGCYEGDASTPWSRVIADVLNVWEHERWISSNDAEIKLLRAWIDDDDNAALVDDAWARQRRSHLAARMERDRAESERLGRFLVEPATPSAATEGA